MTRRTLCCSLVAVLVPLLSAAAQDPAEEWEAYQATVESESPEESIERLDGPFPPTKLQEVQLGFLRGQPLDSAQALLGDDPRMRKLRRAIGRAEPGRRDELAAAVIAKLEAVFEERQALDEVPRPGETPSGIALIILAAQYDREGDALPLLLAWYEAEGPSEDDPGLVQGSEAHFALAAMHAILTRLETPPDPAHDFTTSMQVMHLEDPPTPRHAELIQSVREWLAAHGD